MRRRLRSTALAAGATALILGAIPSAGAADGLPVPFDGDQNTGVPSLEGGLRYSAVTIGNHTELLMIATGTGDIVRSRELDGVWAIPLVAYDGTPSGISANGRVLALIEPRIRFPRATTTLSLRSANTFAPIARIELDGDFSFDAISPDGETVYLIEYTDARDPTAYEVRAYDVERGRLLPDPIVDPNEEGEDMAGFPQTRAISPDGRWAYTLYAVAGRHHPPFIHALDTEGATAVCIDLDALADHRRIDRLSLRPSADGSTLAVTEAGDPLATVDLETFEVSAVPPPTATTAQADDDGGTAIALILIGGGVVLVAGAGVLVLRRRRRPVDEDELERLLDLERERDPVG